MRPCRCDTPLPSKDPRWPTTCNSCGFFVDPALTEIDKPLAEFFDRLAEAQFHYGPEGSLLTPDWWDDFREHCTVREITGRDRFGLTYLTRDNPAEACEEAADGALYMLLHGLRAEREGWADDIDVRLTAALHFALAHRYARLIGQKQRGSTGPGMDEP